MIDFSLDEMLELARQAELQKRVAEEVSSRHRDALRELAAPEPIPETSVVALLHAIKDDEGFDISAGTQGTIVSIYNGGEAYCIELPEAYQGSDRLGLATVWPADFRLVWRFGDPRPVTLPEDLRGKLGDDDDSQAHGPTFQVSRRDQKR